MFGSGWFVWLLIGLGLLLILSPNLGLGTTA